MKRKFQSLRWLIFMLLCCTVATTHASATVNIQGAETIGQYNGYPLFAIESDSITVSSRYESFNKIWIDDIQVAYISSSSSYTYTLDISDYRDNIHCLKLRGGSGNSMGICYFTCILPIEGIYYSVMDNEAVVIGSKTDIAIANILSEYEYDGISYPVTKISESAFAVRSNLTTVTIPNSVKSIGESAFKSCSSLDSLTFNAENCYISGGSANPAFPRSITHLTIGDKVTKIPAYFLYNGNRIENLTIPNSVTSIGEYAFNESVYLKSLTLGAALKTIEKNAFCGYYSRPISIPKVFWLGNTPPEGASIIRAYKEYASNDQYGDSYEIYPFLSSKFIVDGIVYVPVSPSERTCNVVDCIYDKNRTNVEISDRVSNRGIEMKVNEICPYSFYENNYIQSLKLSNNGSIGYEAFYNCSKVETLKLLNNGSIGISAFDNCSKAETLELGQGIEKILDFAFASCSSIKEVSIPNSVIQLGYSAFYSCSALKSVSIGTGILKLPGGVFASCSSLTSLSIPNNVLSIEGSAFSSCVSLADVSFEGLDEQMISQSFPDWTSTNYASGSTSEQEYTFSVVSGDVLTFNYSVANEYDKLIVRINDTIVVSENKNKLGIYRKEFTANEQVSLYMAYSKGISGNAEASVTDIWLNDQRLELGSNGTNPLFADCPLDEVYIGRKLSYETSSDYGYSPFYRNTSLRTVEITDAETQIYDNEFYGCSNLKSLKIGNGVKSIGNWAFSGCSSLDYFSAGFHVESIGKEAFSDCTGLKKYYSYSIIPPVCSSQALDDINKWDCTLYVPANSSDEYKAANQWKEFFFVDEMDAVLVADIKLNMSEISMTIGETFQLTAEVLPSNATNQSVVWESSNPECVTIDGNGLVSAISDGTSMITVKSADGNCEATCLVSVSPDSGIEDIIVSSADGIYAVYNLQGILVLKTEDIESVKQLPAGLYIVNGKKMIIR